MKCKKISLTIAEQTATPVIQVVATGDTNNNGDEVNGVAGGVYAAQPLNSIYTIHQV